MRIEFFKTASDFRAWLQANHGNKAELAVGFCKKSSRRPSVTYSEAVDETLCFGWIDGVRNSIDDGTYRVRFTPRKSVSQWSAVNINRVRRLIKQRKMTPTGLAAYAGAETQPRAYSYEQRNTAKLNAASERNFRANKARMEVFLKPAAVVSPYRYLLGAQRQERRDQAKTAGSIDCRFRSGPIYQTLGTQSVLPKRNQKVIEPLCRVFYLLTVIGFSW